MAYDEELADRVREVLGSRARFEEIRMFGGLCFTVRGNMVAGVLKDDLMARVGPDAYESALRRPGARPMDFTKGPIRGFVFVAPDGVGTKRALAGWIDRALAYNATLPAKKAGRGRSRARRASARRSLPAPAPRPGRRPRRTSTPRAASRPGRRSPR